MKLDWFPHYRSSCYSSYLVLGVGLITAVENVPEPLLRTAYLLILRFLWLGHCFRLKKKGGQMF